MAWGVQNGVIFMLARFSRDVHSASQ